MNSTVVEPLAETPAEAAGAGAVKNRKYTLPQILRWLGAIVLLASAVSFSLQSWIGMSSLMRYYTFLGFTLALCAAGIFCGVRMKEDKGARTFLAIAAAFLPAHFMQLGAMLYAALVGTPPFLPSFFVLTVPGLPAIATALAIAVPILTAVAFFGFSAMSRAEAKRLTALFLVGNGLLLLPTRNADVIALLVAGLFGLIVNEEFRRFAKNSAMRTWDGIAARVITYSPISVLVIRSFILYPTSALLVSVIFALGAAIAYLIARETPKESALGDTMEIMTIPLVALSWCNFLEGTVFNPMLTTLLLPFKSEIILPITALPIAAFIAAMSVRSRLGGVGYRRLASWLAIGSVILQLAAVPGLFSAFLCILVSIGTIAGSFEAEEKGLFYSGSAGLAAGLVYHLHYAADLYALSPWLTLAVLGTMTLLVSSYLERNLATIVERVTGFRNRIAEWQ